MKSDYSHTIGGLFSFDLPLGLLLAFIFHNIVRDGVFDNLPLFLKSRFSALRLFQWNDDFKKNWLVVIVSILIGAFSHLLWDNFTHAHGYFVEVIPALAGNINFSDIQIPIYRLLQHASTVIGGIVIAFVVFKLPADTQIKETISVKFWAVVVGITLIIIAIRVLCGLDLKQYGNIIATGISAGLISLILAPLLVKQAR